MCYTTSLWGGRTDKMENEQHNYKTFTKSVSKCNQCKENIFNFKTRPLMCRAFPGRWQTLNHISNPTPLLSHWVSGSRWQIWHLAAVSTGGTRTEGWSGGSTADFHTSLNDLVWMQGSLKSRKYAQDQHTQKNLLKKSRACTRFPSKVVPPPPV